jgi:hypothetical protein
VYRFASYMLAAIWPLHILVLHLVGTLMFWLHFLKIQIYVAAPPAHRLHSLLGFHWLLVFIIESFLSVLSVI